MAVAVGFLGWALWVQREAVVDALALAGWTTVALAFFVSAVFLALTFIAWRIILQDVGARISWGGATVVYGVGQLGKYVPGGVWNIVAGAELGTSHRVPRRATVVSLAVASVLTLVTGFAVGTLSFLFAPRLAGDWWWVALVLSPIVVCLFPPVMNRLIALGMRMLRREALPSSMSYRGLGGATGVTLAAWVASGVQLWLIAVGMGMTPSPTSLIVCVGASALGWAVGYVAVFAPAGVGVREVVVLVALGGMLPEGSVLTAVVLSRVLMIVADLVFAGVGFTVARVARRRATSAEGAR
jgi:uncharacterized membrane protein YbhN (UPF0104 family)